MLEAMASSRKIKQYKTPLLTIFAFLFGCMLTINLTPIDRTCRIEDADREYNIMKNSKLRNPEVIILILSAPKNANKRNTIRETWLKLQGEEHINQRAARFKMKHFFAVGSADLSADEILHLSTEQSKFSDLLLLPMHDNYQNLTLKVIKSFEWLNEQFNYGLGFKYVIKCDDDSFLRLDRLSSEILHTELMLLNTRRMHIRDVVRDTSPFVTINAQINGGNEPKIMSLYWGYFNGKAHIKKDGKWSESEWIACDRYTPYAQGGGYILSKALVTYIAKNANSLRHFSCEDVSVGFWLAPVTNILRIHDIRFDTEWTTRGCQNQYLITHNISEPEMVKMYKNIVQTKNLCTSQVITRHHYAYNWAKPPSACCNVEKV